MIAGYFWHLSEPADQVSILGTSAKWGARPIGAYNRSSEIYIALGNFCRLGVLLWSAELLHQGVHYSIWLMLDSDSFVPRCLPHNDFMFSFVATCIESLMSFGRNI